MLLEALALGTPVAAMDTGGTREILATARAGCWWPTSRGWARRVARLAGDAGAARAARRGGARERARAFAPEALVPRYEAVYRRLRVRVALLSRARAPAAPPGGMERAVYHLARAPAARAAWRRCSSRARHAARARSPARW